MTEPTEIQQYKSDVDLSYQHYMEVMVGDLPEGNKPTRTEVLSFLELCKFRGLNPYTREIFLIKYSGRPATTIVSKDAFLSRATSNSDFDGLQAGVIVERDGKEERLVGSFKLPSDKLLGGWCDVYLKSRSHPSSCTVDISEYNSHQSTWSKIPLTMIRKVAVVQALREAFPAQFGGLYDASEMQQAVQNVDIVALVDNEVKAPPPPSVQHHEEHEVEERSVLDEVFGVPEDVPASTPVQPSFTSPNTNTDGICRTAEHMDGLARSCKANSPCLNPLNLPKVELVCPVHLADRFFMKSGSNMRSYAHPTGIYKAVMVRGEEVEKEQWCNRGTMLKEIGIQEIAGNKDVIAEYLSSLESPLAEQTPFS